MLDVVNTAYNNLDCNLNTGLTFIDCKKAFDTVCRKVLLTKLKNNGIPGAAYSLIDLYVLNRKLFVLLNQFCSNITKISYGVSLGSSLGPLFFLIYVNDFINALECTPELFADDACLLVQASYSFILQSKINKKLEQLHFWCCAIKHTINVLKSNAVIIPPKLTDDPKKT